MFLSDLAIRRPVLASMASAALVLFGIIGYPQVMESAVTDVLEEQSSSLEGPRQMPSSGEQRSNVTLEFNLERPIEAAAQDVNSAIRTRNVAVPAGRIESDRQEFSTRSMGELKTPEQLGSLVVISDGGQLVRLPMSSREVTP